MTVVMWLFKTKSETHLQLEDFFKKYFCWSTVFPCCSDEQIQCSSQIWYSDCKWSFTQ